MTSSSPIDPRTLTERFLMLVLVMALGVLAGCIADTAEDTDLPWSSNKSWEGLAPISPTIMDRYE